ncbi:precorrin-4 C(11)-methyltransferase [Treponema sp.]|uniref:precorrin-4 C(11)-methyltransferase n=1 Tax=Treponema sp. TaxID=166 RepID=UPI00388E031C
MIYFIGAGPGDVELITVKGQKILKKADVVIYAGSLVNPDLLKYCKTGTRIFNSAQMTLEEVLEVIKSSDSENKTVVRLHTGDPCLYGAIREQMDELDKMNLKYESIPGVSSFCAAASSLNLEYTLPDVSQTVIISRLQGRTSVPEKESLRSLASHNATLVLFLSSGMTEKVREELLQSGIKGQTPAAIVYKASWKEEKKVICTVETLSKAAQENNISKTALIIIGEVVSKTNYSRSRLYAPDFSTEFRKAK